MGRPECIGVFRESFDLALRIQDRPEAAVVAFNLGHAYLSLPPLRNLDEAERWYRKSADLRTKSDQMLRAASLVQLSIVAYERFLEARAAKKPQPELLRHFNDALRGCREGLEMTPPDAVGQLAAAHSELGAIYDAGGDLDHSLHHYRETIRLFEVQGNLYHAATARYNVALVLAQASRFADARQYAEAALRDYQTYGANAADEVQRMLDLISQIAKAATA
jgi:tetratricopeptide (TPR) repeat protein